tara:strand:- start:205 stop:537 length:333 start_codon:yes stop_codon:yes gene_type:complete
MNDITIRQLISNDWEIFKNLRLDTLKNYPEVYGSHYHEETQQTEEEWRKLLDNKAHAVFGLFKIIVSHRQDNVASKKANQAFGLITTHIVEKTWPDGKIISEEFYELVIR